jgi:hypothetical protein
LVDKLLRQKENWGLMAMLIETALNIDEDPIRIGSQIKEKILP